MITLEQLNTLREIFDMYEDDEHLCSKIDLSYNRHRYFTMVFGKLGEEECYELFGEATEPWMHPKE